MYISLFVLLSVKFIGVEIAGSRRWFDLGFATIQPSEFGKVTTAIALAWFISSRGERMKEFGNFCVSILIVAIPAGLVFLEPDLGSTMVYCSIWLAMMLVAGRAGYYLAGYSWLPFLRYISPGRGCFRNISAPDWTRFLTPKST